MPGAYQPVEPSSLAILPIISPQREASSWLQVQVEAARASWYYLGAVRVQVWLDAPMDVTAIANKADCTRANYIEFRQTAQNFLIRSAK